MIFDSRGAGRFEIPEQWWNAAGMPTFGINGATAYLASDLPELPTTHLLLSTIFVPARNPGVPSFREPRMICVLRGIRLNHAMPPVQVEKYSATPADGFDYRLYDGRHRVCASIAVGYSHVPAVIVDMADVTRP